MKSFNMAKNHLKNFTNHIRQKLGTPVFLNNYEYCTNWCLMHFWHSVHYGKSLVLLIYLKINISAVFHVSFNNYFPKLFCLLICWCWIIYIYIYIYIYYIYIYKHKNVGLYRNDGLAVIHQANKPKMDRIRKDIIALFKSEGLSITVDTNLIETNFLEIQNRDGKVFSL